MSNNNTPVATISQIIELAPIIRDAGCFLALYGKGGIGKSSLLIPIADALGVEHHNAILWNCSGYGPQEVTGYGIPDSKTHDLWFSAPEILPTIERVGNDPYIMMLDELAEWDVQVQALMRSLAAPSGRNPMIGSHELGPNGFFIIASNRRQDGSRSSVLSAPLVSRCANFIIEPSLNDWSDWAAENDLASSGAYAFLQFGDSALMQGEVSHFAPDVPSPWNGSPHPSPRGWEKVCRATLEGKPLNDQPALLQLFLTGTVGADAGNACFAFMQTINRVLPMIKKVRAGGDPPTDPAELYALNHAALRIANREASKDPEAYIASGDADWLVNLFTKSGGELARWGYGTALAIGLPLDQHSQSRELAGVAAQG